jgi:hypothetical protein
MGRLSQDRHQKSMGYSRALDRISREGLGLANGTFVSNRGERLYLVEMTVSTSGAQARRWFAISNFLLKTTGPPRASDLGSLSWAGLMVKG